MDRWRFRDRWIGLWGWWLGLLGVMLGLVVVVGHARPRARVWAAQPLEVRVLRVETVRFPVVDVVTWVWHPDERQVPPALTREHITVLEDGQPLEPQQVSLVRPGLQWVVALNPDRGFALRDSQGVSRYEYVVYQLASWLERQPTGMHQMALYIANGPRIAGTQDPRALLQTLRAYAPPREAASPSLIPLREALRLAQSTPPRPDMRRSVLFITAPLEETFLNGLPTLAQQAQVADIQVSVWLVGALPRLEAQREAWEAFVAQTRGHLALFSGVEVLPDLNQELDRYNRLYRVSYISPRRESGEVNLQVQVTWQGAAGRSPAYRFPLDLQPPEPRVLNLPERIVRQPVGEGDDRLTPAQVRLNVQIDFPGGRPRDLARVVLLVNGEPVAQRTTPPFDRLVWDLTPYRESQVVTVAVMAEDILGLQGQSPPQQVRIEVVAPQEDRPAARPQPARTPAARVDAQEGVGLIVPVALSAGAVLGVVLWATWRRYRARPRARALSRSAPASSGPAPTRWALELIPLEPEDDVAAFQVKAREVVVGSDPEQAQWVLRDPSISPRHARFWYQPEQQRYYVADMGSVAGTWVNYAPVSSSGLALESGDLLFLGRKGFRLRYVPLNGES